VAEQAGARPRVLLLSELGFNPYTSCLLTSEETIRERPDAVRRLVRACARGWAGYVADPTPAHRLILEANPEMSPAALDYGARSLVPLIHGDDQDAGIGRMTAERWRQLLNQLEETELLEPGSVDPREAFTTEFLPGTVAE
jgi:NitT/TauT family transport system substrate-binding protein